MTEDVRPPPGRSGVSADATVRLLSAKGAAAVPHPGGKLLDHLRRVHATLLDWGARPELRLAGLCHAFYGTDGFRVPLGDPGRRAELADAIGAGAEQIVYTYASCDRARSYPRLTEPGGAFIDRFTGEPLDLAPGERRDFAELTAANELDVLAHARDPAPVEAAGLLDLLTGWEPLLSAPAARAVRAARRAAGGR
ncbi:DUF6817 domain-containing protein [Spirillospora sp. NPDC050679]